ncbi:MAG: preprotein translocase subunit SecG [Pseudodesulfovibrio sp.]|uniref:Protein-export membrane protein SecG n=1 Tax=Pseudodesulfovibrio aespoeensis (strain ATCC 700646 / DSM 10631 / Aspo-2) TaxID=643562 RepID=E6VX63_PSEA9|nr:MULTISPECIES: preprotein translocase subunit SecG [Pseudodesulfovibrio]MBU4378328.1 preprotein translocase subunit SecG [Pseudomonadota bacterium]MCG2733913.1 preprotein translocase subunit SecG [Pseudodesulfovibrio aespoeensis]ADU62569.1 preprotein translocase, SecG subunit [Pseudodesulfovibrio aespoeensis Aspo-2]MBU4476173.1 preprotein translocase subunit SecG [Pseudomonadota bacterium]MBU4516532.1 preprotein translocase subunit SecG [Pseudomonadota bacterium]
MDNLVIVIHVLACIFLIGAVMLQSGHEGMGVIFGGGSSTMFGSTGAGGILVKITAGLATVFLITSLTYNVITGNKVSTQDSLMLKGDGIVQPIVPADQQKPGVKFMDTGDKAKSE